MKVLVVDDSVVFRSAIKTALLDSDLVSDVEIAANGKIAIDKLKSKKFDSVTLDLEMPVMDGIETIKNIREFDKDIPIIIFSAQNITAANKTLEALQMGADDFVSKLTTAMNIDENLKMIREELIPRFRALIERTSRRRGGSVGQARPVISEPKVFTDEVKVNIEDIHNFRPDIICIASSTGGPDMLIKVFSGLKELKVPVVIVQHMPPIFTTQLAKTLNSLSPNTVVEAKIGDRLKPGHVYLAPGDYHMTVKKAKESGEYIISLDQTEKVCFVRPAADVLFKSVVDHFEGKIAGFVFTGMGNDGAEGARRIKSRGGKILIQDEESCVVWGMPRAVFENKSYDGIFSPEELIEKINIMAKK